MLQSKNDMRVGFRFTFRRYWEEVVLELMIEILKRIFKKN